MNKFNDIVDKILGIMGYDIYNTYIKTYLDSQKSLKEYKFEHELALKKQIAESNTLSLEAKITINTLLDKNLSDFKRQLNILGIAIDNFQANANAHNLSRDWILDFFDKASRITEQDTQLIWGKFLAYAASDKNICSKTLLNSIFLMGTEEFKDFLSVCQFTFSEVGMGSQTEQITAYPIIYYTKHIKTYTENRISTLRLHKLQTLGLIEVDMKDEYVFSKKTIKLIYKNKIIELEHDKKIKIGNVRFTYEGFLLYQMTDKIYNSNVLEYILEIWRRRKYTIYLNESRLTPNES